MNVIVLGLPLGAITDKDGRFLIRGLSDGTYKLRFLGQGFDRKNVEVTVRNGQGDVGIVPVFRRKATSFVVGSEAPASPLLTCYMRLATKKPRVGEALRFSVAITNWGKEAICLGYAVDDSDGGRFPWVRLRVEGPNNGFIVPAFMRCGFENPLTEDDLICLEPGASFDPFGHGWMDPRASLGRPRRPGNYVAFFEYRTNEPDGRRWLGSAPGGGPSVIETLKRIPAIRLADTLRFEVAP